MTVIGALSIYKEKIKAIDKAKILSLIYALSIPFLIHSISLNKPYGAIIAVSLHGFWVGNFAAYAGLSMITNTNKNVRCQIVLPAYAFGVGILGASSPYALLYLNRFIHIKYAAIYLSAIALMTYITIVITTKLLDNSENLMAVTNES